MQSCRQEDYKIVNYVSTDSTNAEALRLIQNGCLDDYVITADQQTQGKGSKGRNWQSLLGNLHASILLRSQTTPIQNQQLPFLVSNAVYSTLNYFAKKDKVNVNIKQKWPNDVLINGKKVAGILLESHTHNQQNYLIIGIGINILASPEQANFPASSLVNEGIILQHTDELLNVLMLEFRRLYQQWCIDYSFKVIRQQWLKRAYNLNKVITIDDGHCKVSGIFKDLDFSGSLVLQMPDQTLRSFVVGDLLSKE